MEAIKNNPLPRGGCVMAIGVFDGVHVGHAFLLEKAKSEAEKLKKPLFVFTFTETPKNEYSKNISLVSEKPRLLEKCGADMVYTADFSRLRGLSPEDFVKNVLIGQFDTYCVVCGYDFRFGSGRRGDTEMLFSLLESDGRECVVIPPVYVGDEIVSSTLIRGYISKGDMEKASKLLGRAYSFSLPVSNGSKIGRTLGFPTINQRFPDELVTPSFGVYACRCEFDGKTMDGVADVGTKPTVDGKGGAVCETHIFGFCGDLYGKTVKTELLRKFRDEKKFASVEELKTAIEEDTKKAKEYFAKKAK